MWPIRVVVFVLVSSVFGSVRPAAQRPLIANMEAAMAELEAGTPDRARAAVDYVLSNLDMARADVLFMVSMGALELKRIDDAGFLYYAGQLRARVDQQRFPPVGTGGGSPMVAIGALRQVIGAEINPAIMREPTVLAAVLTRLDAWSVGTAPGYDPGWEYTTARTAADVKALTDTVKAEYLRGGREILSLITIPEYLAALRESQAAGEADMSDETKLNAALERHRKARERMCAIEKQMKIQAACSNRSQ
jgi:hypothetical protein